MEKIDLNALSAVVGGAGLLAPTTTFRVGPKLVRVEQQGHYINGSYRKPNALIVNKSGTMHQGTASRVGF